MITLMITVKLEEQYREKLSLKEKQIEEVLKERQELFNMAFQQDMQLYKESGIVPNIRCTWIRFLGNRDPIKLH